MKNVTIKLQNIKYFYKQKYSKQQKEFLFNRI